ncbi:AmmeMemoRadiSam system protein B [Candidatus Uhrbacteria bacterium]|nr:AmmeMemoRadiSam system protein B [Candidatus Uhrbacteria bacterium]
MIVFAAFTPHSPLLMDSIGKENLKYLEDSRTALGKLAASLEASRPDVIFIVSSHTLLHEEAFSLNLHDQYVAELKDFGDHSTHKTFMPDLELTTTIQRLARTSQIPFVLESYESLDYGSSVPLLLLTQRIQPKLIPIAYAGMDRKAHMAFGRLLKEVALMSDKRIAVIASGDLAHSLTSEAPVGFRKEGKQFDETLVRCVEQFSASALLSLDEEIIEQSAQCALKPMLVLLGLLERMHVRSELLSYEAPFGVGYLVAQFHVL